jgi:hypothetical protein
VLLLRRFLITASAGVYVLTGQAVEFLWPVATSDWLNEDAVSGLWTKEGAENATWTKASAASARWTKPSVVSSAWTKITGLSGLWTKEDST